MWKRRSSDALLTFALWKRKRNEEKPPSPLAPGPRTRPVSLAAPFPPEETSEVSIGCLITERFNNRAGSFHLLGGAVEVSSAPVSSPRVKRPGIKRLLRLLLMLTC